MSKYRCIFCQSPEKLSKEHIWADWLKAYLPRSAGRTSHLVTRGNSTPQKGKLDRPGDIHAQRLQVVCRPCNHGWMGKLQEAAKPHLVQLIAGSWVNLDLEAQRIIAAWSTMFTMVNEFSDPPTATIPQAQRTSFMEATSAAIYETSFMETNPVAQDWIIWLGRADFKRFHPANVNHFGIMRLVSGPKGLPKFHFFQSTGFTVGNLFIQTLAASQWTLEPIKFAKQVAKKFDLRVIHPPVAPMTGRFPRFLDWNGFYDVSNSFAAALGARPFRRP